MLFLFFAVVLAASQPDHELDRAAAEAAAYWRGGRVRAHEEPELPAPRIEFNTSESSHVLMDYHGESLVQECMEYYLDKHTEEDRLRNKILNRQNKALEEAGSGTSARESADVGSRTNAPTGMITYLLMENSERTIHKDLMLSLHCLHRFFGGYPVTVFHTNASTVAELDFIRSSAPGGLQLALEEVELRYPSSISEFPGGPEAYMAPPHCTMDGQHWWSTHRSCGCRCPAWRPQCWPLNWMHATRFFTADMFRTKTFRQGGFDFFLRLDTDLFFVRKPEVDPFRFMGRSGCAMMYDKVSREAPGCHDGFDEHTLEFIRQYGYMGEPDKELLHVGHGPGAAGGQWSFGDARLFSSDRYLRFADFMAEGIYRHRWADQLFLVRGLSLFGPRATIPFRPVKGRTGFEMSGTPKGPAHWEPPATSICMSNLFEGGVEEGFVHRKGGFRDPMLLRHCAAPAP